MQSTADKLCRDVRVVVQDAEELIKATAGDIEDRTREARAKLAGALVVAKDSLSKAELTASDRVRAADVWMRKNAFYSMGAAFVVGIVLGALVIRRSSD